MFLKFTIFYGHIWRSQFKNEYFTSAARHEWQRALEGFEEKIIDEALEECLKQREMPPTMTQFIEYCRQLSNKSKGFYCPEPVEKAHPSVAEDNLKKIKVMLNMRIQ